MMNVTTCPKCHCYLEIKDNELLPVKAKEVCLKCLEDKPTWVRYTQFSGNHYYCEPCAKQESDFGKEDPSYFFWEELRK